MAIDGLMLEMDQHMANANTVKKAVLETLLNNKLIDEKVFEEYNIQWQIIIFKHSWFKTWFEKFKSKDGANLDGYSYKFVKIE